MCSTSMRCGIWSRCGWILLTVVVAGVLAVPGHAGTQARAISGHPRLFFTAEQIPTLQAQAATTHASWGVPVAPSVSERMFQTGDSRLLVSGLVDNEPFEVHYDQALVTVTGQSNTEILLFAPQATRLIVNEIDWAFSREGDHIRFSPCPTLKLDVVPSEGGQVQALPEPDFTETRYRSGVDVSLTASAANGFRFAFWSGDASGSDNPTIIRMNGNKQVSAHFVLYSPLGCVPSLTDPVVTICTSE